MLKKISHIIIVLLLLVTTMGLTIDKHYCGTRLVSVGILNEAESCCDMDDDCCHNDTETFKLNVDYTYSQINTDFNQVPTELSALSFCYLSFFEGNTSDVVFSIYIPPRKTQTTLSDFQTYRL